MKYNRKIGILTLLLATVFWLGGFCSPAWADIYTPEIGSVSWKNQGGGVYTSDPKKDPSAKKSS